MTDTITPPLSLRKEAVRTANGMYHYDDISYGITMHVWIQKLHNYTANNWTFVPLTRGTFGYDNLAMSIGAVFLEEADEDSVYASTDPAGVAAMASAVHYGWCQNYEFWRDNAPWENPQYLYIKPYAPLGDTRRNVCAELSYNELSEDERVKDCVIARGIMHIREEQLALANC